MASYSYPGFLLEQRYPDRIGTAVFMQDLFHYLFPKVANNAAFLADHQDMMLQLRQKLSALLSAVCRPEDVDRLLQEWVLNLRALVEALLRDANFLLSKDPASCSLAEIISTYPGFRALFYYRAAHQLLGQGVQLLPRLITEIAHTLTGIDIHPAAQVAVPFCIDHGTGVVIGETAVIGPGCVIYQGVTLGAASVKKELAATKRHPTLEKNVIVYANATILGGQTVIGTGAVIGGNTWITQSVPPHHIVLTVPQHEMIARPIDGEPYNFVI